MKVEAFYVLKVFGLYKDVDAKVTELLSIISKLSEKWLQVQGFNSRLFLV